MSELSDDILLTQLQQASAFMLEVRQAQVESGKRCISSVHLTTEQQYAITGAANASSFVEAVKQSTETDLPLQYLFERFEEMCRRRKIAIDAPLRPALVKLLAGELFANQRALGASAKQLVSVTLYQGAIGPELVNEFVEFRDRPGILRQAAVERSFDPRNYLRSVVNTISVLEIDPEFERFRDTPGVFTYAAANNTKDHRGIIRKESANIDEK